jgi:hypothetical protein
METKTSQITQEANAFADAGMNRHVTFAMSEPAKLYDSAPVVGVWLRTDQSIRITAVQVACDKVPASEVLCSLCHAKQFTGLVDPVVISHIDTVRGVFAATGLHVDVPEGRCIYLQFRARPHAAIGQILCQIDYRRA